jgi:hypothetical protein
MRKHKVLIERSLLLPIPAEQVPSHGYCGMRFILPQRFEVSTGLNYQPQPIANVYATVERRLDADTTLVRIPLSTQYC